MADTKTVQIIIEAQAKVDGATKEVASKLDGLKGKIESMSPTFKKMAVVGASVFAGVSAEIYKSLEAAGEAAKVQAQLGAVLKSTGGIAGVTAEKALELSRALQKTTTYGDEAILSAENMLLTFTNIGKDVFPDAIGTVLDMSTALGQDLKSSSIQLGKALNDPILGISALRKVGVNFTKEQQEQVKVMVESGKVMEAQKFILKELANEFGGSASAEAQTFAGRLKQVKERLGDVQESIGVALIPVVESLLNKLVPVIDKVGVWIEENPKLTKNILLVAGAIGALLLVMGTVGLALPGIIASVGALSTAFTFLAANPIVLVLGGLVLIANSLKNQIAKLYGVKVTWLDVWNEIKKGFKSVTDWIADRILWVMDKIDMVKNAYHKVVDTVSSVGKGVGNAVSSVGSAIGSVFTPPESTRSSPLTADEVSPSTPNYNIVFNGDITDKNEFLKKLKDSMSQVLSVKQAMP